MPSDRSWPRFTSAAFSISSSSETELPLGETPVSATVWSVSAKSAGEPVSAAAVPFAIAMVVFAASAASTSGTAHTPAGIAPSAPTATGVPAGWPFTTGVRVRVAREASVSESPTVRLEQDGLSVQLPAGFGLDADDGMWRATGGDPDFRLQIAVEHLYQLPAQTMAEQLLADIEADPEVELVDTDGVAVTYLERAADGSQALWRTWPDGAVQLFVGCHTRLEPTVVQRATCRMAMESAAYQGADVGP